MTLDPDHIETGKHVLRLMASGLFVLALFYLIYCLFADMFHGRK